MEFLLSGIAYMNSSPVSWILMVFGVFMGIIFGCIPGLTATLGVTLMIPFTFTMEPIEGLSLLIGIYVGGISGGLITATLINIPGTPASLVTTWDGYPMAKNGHPDKALQIGTFASLVGGIASAFALIFIAPQLAKVALAFSSWEYFSLSFLGLSIVIVMTGKDPLNGLIGAVLGLILGCVGIDAVTGLSRLSFGQWQLQAGISSTALMMALFAVREIFVQLGDIDKTKTKMETKRISFYPPFADMKGCGRTFLIGSVFGTVIGILPGVAQSAASILTYNQARQMSKAPEKFGTGCAEGIIASETANNAVNGGALIPLLTLGIPGDMTTAALIGGLMIHGIQPGPMLFRTSGKLVGGIMIVYFVSNIVMYLMQLGLMRVFLKIIEVPSALLFPAIIMSCIMGVYSLNSRYFDIWILIVFGIAGYILTRCGVGVAPLILGFILGPGVDKNFRTAMIAAKGNILSIISHPIAFVMFLVAISFMLWPLISAKKNKR